MNSAEKVKVHFDSLSTSYEKNYSEEKSGKTHDFRTRLRLVTQIIEQDSGALLDCACGTGEITAQALKSGNFTTAILSDISAPMLDIAKTRMTGVPVSTNVHYQQIDIFKYEPDTGMKFDVILCLGLLAHTGSLQAMLVHLKSMLRTDGKIVLQSSLAGHWGIRFVRLLTSKIYVKKHRYCINYYTIKDIENCIRLSGLEIKLCQRYNFGWPFGDKITRLGNYWLEVFMQSFSAKYGSDAIFVITHHGKSVE
jgi:2-polyprenyl-3-methyl-5-hydroxy-6-metoxy-1,4-benzoquinol methylase